MNKQETIGIIVRKLKDRAQSRIFNASLDVGDVATVSAKHIDFNAQAEKLYEQALNRLVHEKIVAIWAESDQR